MDAPKKPSLDQLLRDSKAQCVDLQAKILVFTEFNLATLEELSELKSSSASRIKRQQRICDEMVAACRQFCIPGEFDLKKFPRLSLAL